jgi:Ca-activated chloride channel family protein
MSFASPLGLLALLVLPAGALLYVAARRRRRRHALRFPATATVAAVVPAVNPWRRRVPLALLALAAATLALALGRPQTTVAVPVENASVVLVIDGSRSMLSQDVQPTRIDAARRAALRFVDRVPARLQLGLIAYNTVPYLTEGPTLEHDRVRSAITTIQADGGTATGDALAEALKRLRQRRNADGDRAPAAIVLLSDGKSTDGQDPVSVARQAGRLHIPISTVALGTSEGMLPNGPFGIPMSVPPDPETLRQIADASGGRAFKVDQADELDQIYERLGSQLGTRRQEREVTAAFAGAGLLLLLGAAGLSTRWRARVG